MEKEQFYNYISSSENLDSSSEGLLRDVVKQYPYFHAARILILINQKKNGSGTLNEQIKANAPLIPDRRKLFFLLNPPKTEEPSIPEDKIVTPVVSDDSETNNLTGEHFILTEENQQVTSDDLEKPVSENAIENVPSDHELLELGDPVIPISEHEKSYYDPQLYTLEIPKDDNSGIEGIEKSINKSNFELIDEFINNNPRIKPNNGPLKEQEDISLNSVTDTEEILSETLAQIYLSQGLFDKAISIYEKLSLKYPEKSSYFAGQILEIKNRKNK